MHRSVHRLPDLGGRAPGAAVAHARRQRHAAPRRRLGRIGAAARPRAGWSTGPGARRDRQRPPSQRGERRSGRRGGRGGPVGRPRRHRRLHLSRAQLRAGGPAITRRRRRGERARRGRRGASAQRNRAGRAQRRLDAERGLHRRERAHRAAAGGVRVQRRPATRTRKLRLVRHRLERGRDRGQRPARPDHPRFRQQGPRRRSVGVGERLRPAARPPRSSYRRVVRTSRDRRSSRPAAISPRSATTCG